MASKTVTRSIVFVFIDCTKQNQLKYRSAIFNSITKYIFSLLKAIYSIIRFRLSPFLKNKKLNGVANVDLVILLIPDACICKTALS